MHENKTLRTSLGGAVCGAANGLFGSGGGMIAVPMLESGGADTKQAHAASLALTMPLSLVSAFIYAQKGSLDLPLALRLLPAGLPGVLAGSAVMKRISPELLRKLFAAVMIYFGTRMLMGW